MGQQAAVEVATTTTADAVTINTAADSYDAGSGAVAGALVSDDDPQRIVDEAPGSAHPQHLGVIE